MVELTVPNMQSYLIPLACLEDNNDLKKKEPIT